MHGLSGPQRVARVPLWPSTPIAPASGLEWARRVAGTPAPTNWTEAMRWLEMIAPDARKDMSRDAAALPAELAPLGELVVRHETVLVEFARLERAGEHAAALAPANEFRACARPG